MSNSGIGLRSFLLEACKVLGIDVHPSGPRQLELRIPGPLRREFGGADVMRVTDDLDLRQHDDRLELLAPGSFVIEAVAALLRRRSSGLQRLVASTPIKLEAEEYLEPLRKRLIPNSAAQSMRTGKLPFGYRLDAVRDSGALRTTLRVVLDVKIFGPAPVHEVFPVLVDLESGEARPTHELGGRSLYDVDSVRLSQAALPEAPSVKEVESALEVALEAVRPTIDQLAGIARGGAEHEMSTQRAELAQYFGEHSEEFRVRSEALKRQFRVAVELRPVTISIVYEMRSRIAAVIVDAVGRSHTLEIDVVAGRTEIPDSLIACGHLNAPLSLQPGVGVACSACAPRCRSCGLGEPDSACRVCKVEGATSCQRCVQRTADGLLACERHSFECVGGELRVRGAETRCADCGREVCESNGHRQTCSAGGEAHCAPCAQARGRTCSDCEAWTCRQHLVVMHDGTSGCPACAKTCAVDGLRHRGVEGGACSVDHGEQTSWTCRAHLLDVDCEHERVCVTHSLTSPIDGVRTCVRCASSCSACGRVVADSQLDCCKSVECAYLACVEETTLSSCKVCGGGSCPAHAQACSASGESLCEAHASTCASCQATFRSDLVEPCGGCKASVCSGCRRATASGVIGCRTCVGACAADGRLHRRRELRRCGADHGSSEHAFCAAHRAQCVGCGEVVCPAHSTVSGISGSLVCRVCAGRCSLCASTLAPSEVSACGTCGAQYCDATEPAPRCKAGGEVVCASHATITRGGALVCGEHRTNCSVCGEALEPDDVTHCAGGREPLCASHRLACAADEAPVCEGHATRTESGLHVCPKHVSRCGHCSCVLDPLDAVLCSVGGEPLCRSHRATCALHQGEILCAEHGLRTRSGALVRRLCVRPTDRCAAGNCGVIVLKSEAEACAVCGTRACEAHGRRCVACDGHPCARHSRTRENGEVICVGCVRVCVVCGPERPFTPDEVSRCTRCGGDACQDRHLVACRIDGATLCTMCAATSPIDTGSFHPEHLKVCDSCQRPSLHPVEGTQLCELCLVFADPVRVPDPIPFAQEIVDEFVKSHAGMIRSRAELRWSVSEKCVLLWVKSGILRRDHVAVFDHEGRLQSSITPRPGRVVRP